MVLLDFFAPTATAAPLPACLASAQPAPRIWTFAVWTREFGSRNPASAVGVPPEDPKAFEFYHFGTPSNPPLVLVPGHSSSMMQWDPKFLYLLKQCYDVYLFDNLGIGFSAFESSDEATMLAAMTWTDMGQFVTSAIQGIRDSAHCQSGACAISTHQPHIMGYAMGGRIATNAVSMEPTFYGRVIKPGGDMMAGTAGDVSGNPDLADELQGAPFASGYTAFHTAIVPWGAALYLQALDAFLESASRIAPY